MHPRGKGPGLSSLARPAALGRSAVLERIDAGDVDVRDDGGVLEWPLTVTADPDVAPSPGDHDLMWISDVIVGAVGEVDPHGLKRPAPDSPV